MNWDNIERYYNELKQDVYEQPDSDGHTKLAEEIIKKWLPKLDPKPKNVLDVGCGTGFCSRFFSGMDYDGVASGIESVDPLIHDFDFNFIPYSDNRFDLVFSRHSLEHSPMPLLTLMEWHRVAKKHLMLILPNPDYYTFIGRNHYAVMEKSQVMWLLRRAGWRVIDKDFSEFTELRFLCHKEERVGPEGFVKTLTAQIYEADRDA